MLGKRKSPKRTMGSTLSSKSANSALEAAAAKNPPKKAIFRIPYLSVRIPAKADNKKSSEHYG